jgi:hypothetical protein
MALFSVLPMAISLTMLETAMAAAEGLELIRPGGCPRPDIKVIMSPQTGLPTCQTAVTDDAHVAGFWNGHDLSV